MAPNGPFPLRRSLTILVLGHEDAPLTRAIVDSLTTHGHEVRQVQNPGEITGEIARTVPDTLVLGPPGEGASQPALLGRVGRDLPPLPVVVVTASQCAHQALEAAAQAPDFLVLGLTDTHLECLPNLVAEAHRRSTLEAQTQRLAAIVQRQRRLLASANTQILEHRHRLLGQEGLRAAVELTGASTRHLNQPLSALMGLVEMLRSKVGDGADSLNTLLDRILLSAEEINTTIARVQSLHSHRLEAHLEGDHCVDVGHDSVSVLVAVGDDTKWERIRSGLRGRSERLAAVRHLDAATALKCLESGTVEVALLDHDMPGLTVADALGRARQASPPVPTIFLISEESPSLIREALMGGAADCLPWTLLTPDILGQAIFQALRQAQIEAEMEGVQDHLRVRVPLDADTGLTMPWRFHHVLAEEFERARRHRRPLTVMVFEVERWDEIVESLGADVGRETLLRFGRTLCPTTRQADCVSLLMGARFAAVLPETRGCDVSPLATRLTRELRSARASDLAGPSHPDVNLSFGLCDLEAPPCAANADELFLRACDSLHRAQSSGEGTTQIWEMTVPMARPTP